MYEIVKPRAKNDYYYRVHSRQHSSNDHDVDDDEEEERLSNERRNESKRGNT